MYLERLWCSLVPLLADRRAGGRSVMGAATRFIGALFRRLRLTLLPGPGTAPARSAGCRAPRGASTRRRASASQRRGGPRGDRVSVTVMLRTLFEDVHEDFRASFRTFLEREVQGEQGRYGEWERAGIVPREVFARAGAGGFLGMAVPERYGGAGVEDFRFNLIVGEETQLTGVGSVGLGMTVHNDVCLPYFLRYCNDAQRE